MIWRTSGTGDGTAVTERDSRAELRREMLVQAAFLRAQNNPFGAGNWNRRVSSAEIMAQALQLQEFLRWKSERRLEALRFLKEGPKK